MNMGPRYTVLEKVEKVLISSVTYSELLLRMYSSYSESDTNETGIDSFGDYDVKLALYTTIQSDSEQPGRTICKNHG
jgi:hypothetical protein